MRKWASNLPYNSAVVVAAADFAAPAVANTVDTANTSSHLLFEKARTLSSIASSPSFYTLTPKFLSLCFSYPPSPAPCCSLRPFFTCFWSSFPISSVPMRVAAYTKENPILHKPRYGICRTVVETQSMDMRGIPAKSRDMGYAGP